MTTPDRDAGDQAGPLGEHAPGAGMTRLRQQFGERVPEVTDADRERAARRYAEVTGQPLHG